jgi:hypothetical protein
MTFLKFIYWLIRILLNIIKRDSESLSKIYVEMERYSPYASIRKLICYWLLWNFYLIDQIDWNKPHLKSFSFWLDQWEYEIKINNKVTI